MSQVTERFTGEILGVGTAEGTRVVVGNWWSSPYGRFADAMVERPDGHRVLFAPTQQIANYVAATYAFDEVQVVPVVVQRRGALFSAAAGPLTLSARMGARTPIGWALHGLPASITAHTWFCRVGNPIARVLLPGVRTHGTANSGRHEFYGAHDVHAVATVDAAWHGRPLGPLMPVTPAPRFGFSSTPGTPSITRVTTTVVRSGESARNANRPIADVGFRKVHTASRHRVRLQRIHVVLL